MRDFSWTVKVDDIWFEKGTRAYPLIDPGMQPAIKKILHGKSLPDAVSSLREYIRVNGKDLIVDNAKKLLPGITLSAEYKERRLKGAPFTHSGYVALDMDNVDKSKMKDLIALNIFEYIGESVSGTGLFGVVPIEDENKHDAHFWGAAALVEEKTGIQVDPLPDVTRFRLWSPSTGSYTARVPKFTICGESKIKEFKTKNSYGKTKAYDLPYYANQCLNMAAKRGVSYNPNTGLNPYIIRVMPYFNHFGISADYACDFIYRHLCLSETFDKVRYPKERLEYDVHHFYEVYKEQHYTQKFRDTESPKWSPEQDEPSALKLGEGQRLSDLKFDIPSECILESPTNSGKTYWAVHNLGKVDILMPTQELAKQAAGEYGLHYVIQGIQPTMDDVQVGTYNAVEKFVKRGVGDRTLFIDEAHNLVFSASKGFRSQVLHQIIAAMPLYRRVILASGTWVETLHPYLRRFHKVIVERENPVTKLAQICYYENRDKALSMKLVKGKLNIVFFNDKDKGRDLGYRLESQGWKVQIFNSMTKPEEEHQEIIETQQVPDDIEVLIVTTLFIEGLNIYNHNIGNLHLLSHGSAELIEQVANRTRNKAPERTIIYIKDKERNPGMNFDFMDYQQKLENDAYHIIDAGESLKVLGVHKNGDFQSQKVLESILGVKRNIVRVVDNAWEVDYLGIGYTALQEKQLNSFQNIEKLERDLERYNFKFIPPETITEDLSPQEKKQKEISSAMSKNFKEKRWADAIASIEDMSHDVICDISIKGHHDSYLVDACKKYLQLNEYLSHKDTITLLEDTKGMARKWTRTKLRLDVLVYKQMVIKSQGNKDIETLEDIFASFPPGTTVTAIEAHKVIAPILRKNPKFKAEKLKTNTTTRFLKDIFNIHEAVTRDGKKIARNYTIINTNPLGVSIAKPLRFPEKLKALESKYKQLKLW